MSLRGETGWQATHQKAYGKERWKELHRALRKPVTHVALVSPFMSEEAQLQKRTELQLIDHEHIPLVSVPSDGRSLEAELDDEGECNDKAAEQTAAASVLAGQATTAVEAIEEEFKNPCYFFDGASVVAALALGAQPGDSVLDLCSAPGGKALVLASIMFQSAKPQVSTATEPAAPTLPAAAAGASENMVPLVDIKIPGHGYGTEKSAEAINSTVLCSAEGKGRLVCNEFSKGRFYRLKRVLQGFLTKELMAPGSQQVHVTNCDAAIGGGGPPVLIHRLGPFDKVLVDAPCTSDRHLAHQGSASLSKWASGAVKANAERQVDLLRCAAVLVRKGGVILYCTCALSTLENDGVIAKFLKRFGAEFSSEPVEDLVVPLPGAEITEHGTMLQPDRCGYGPIYFARLRKH